MSERRRLRPGPLSAGQLIVATLVTFAVAIAMVIGAITWSGGDDGGSTTIPAENQPAFFSPGGNSLTASPVTAGG